MSDCITTHFPSHTGEGSIAAHTWLPDCSEGEIKGVIQFVHGMSEYVKRFDHVAQYLTGLGYVFAGEDHAGHGESLPDDEHTGFFAKEDGWNKVVLDTYELHKQLKQRYPDKKHILYGHSMGSFIARACASRYPGEYDAFIFSGTAGHNPGIGLGKLIAAREIKHRGAMGHSRLLDALVIGPYIQSVRNRRTDFDWLSRDPEVVINTSMIRSAALISAAQAIAICSAALKRSAARTGPARSRMSQSISFRAIRTLWAEWARVCARSATGWSGQERPMSFSSSTRAEGMRCITKPTPTKR